MRRAVFLFAAASADAATVAAAKAKMHALHKILTGELHFKNKAAVKECNIAHQFGDGWEAELAEYAKTLPAEQKNVLQRQVARVKLTRYTVAELAAYCGEGAANLDAVAREANIEDGVVFLREKGVEAFEKYIAQEAVNAKWKPEDVKKFADAVKAKAQSAG